jgi:hypothetical protein
VGEKDENDEAYLNTLILITSLQTSASIVLRGPKLLPVVPALAKKKSRRPCSFAAWLQTDSMRVAEAASPVKW